MALVAGKLTCIIRRERDRACLKLRARILLPGSCAACLCATSMNILRMDAQNG